MVTRACLRYAREGQNVTQAGPKCHTSRAKMSHKGQNVTQSCYNGLHDPWKFLPYSEGHWQSPCTALTAGILPAVRAVQGDCETVYNGNKFVWWAISSDWCVPAGHDNILICHCWRELDWFWSTWVHMSIIYGKLGGSHKELWANSNYRVWVYMHTSLGMCTCVGIYYGTRLEGRWLLKSLWWKNI